MGALISTRRAGEYLITDSQLTPRQSFVLRSAASPGATISVACRRSPCGPDACRPLARTFAKTQLRRPCFVPCQRVADASPYDDVLRRYRVHLDLASEAGNIDAHEVMFVNVGSSPHGAKQLVFGHHTARVARHCIGFRPAGNCCCPLPGTTGGYRAPRDCFQGQTTRYRVLVRIYYKI